MMYLRIFPLALFVGTVLFLSAGGLDVWSFWAYPAAVWLTAGSVYTLLLRKSPELVAERFKPPNDRDRKSRLLSLPIAIAHYVIAGLDVGRYAWAPAPTAVRILGLGLVVASLVVVGWVLLSNPYASSAVRIQAERKQTVISAGPYALVRHPMYLGVVLFAVGSGPGLGSWWASLAMVPLLAVFARRTLFEDRMLHEELAGYADYSKRVRWRVLPGLF